MNRRMEIWGIYYASSLSSFCFNLLMPCLILFMPPLLSSQLPFQSPSLNKEICGGGKKMKESGN